MFVQYICNVVADGNEELEQQQEDGDCYVMRSAGDLRYFLLLRTYLGMWPYLGT